MQTIEYLLHGFAIALTWKNLFYCAIGCLWGTVVGVLPGVGPLAGMALLLPLTYKLDPTGAIIMLAGIFYGAMYGGSTTSILVRMPGEAASIITCIDGYQMARKGRAGVALFLAGAGSFVGGTLSILGLMLFAPILADAMLRVGPAAEFILMVFALLVVSFVSTGNTLKVVAMIIVGLLLASIGIDSLTGWSRFTFGNYALSDGLNFVALSIGLFGVSEILLSFEEAAKVKPIKPKLRELLPGREDVRAAQGPVLRGSLIGFVFGIFPGVSHIVSTFVSYTVEKRLSKTPEQFGQGAIAGVAGPETANNATTGSSLIPLLVLGIPAIPSTAILLSAFLIHGVQPGPQLIHDHPEVFWGLVASMYIGNVILLALNIPLVGIFINLLRLPFGYLAPIILLISIIGVYSVNSNIFDVWVMLASGVVGYLMRKFDYDVAPLLLALVLGDRIETNFRRALTISDGDYSIFAQGPAARVFICALALVLILQGMAIAAGYRKRLASPGS